MLDREKATLLCLELKWLSGKRLSGKAVINSSDELAELESQMWLYVINDRIHSSEEVLYIAVSKLSSCTIWSCKYFRLYSKRLICKERNLLQGFFFVFLFVFFFFLLNVCWIFLVQTS